MRKYNLNKTTAFAFNIHDQVLVHKSAFRSQHHISDINKFDDRWHGPYTIIKVINPNAFQLDFPPSLKKHNVINISFLRPYKTSTQFPRQHPDFLFPPPEQTDNENDTTPDDNYEVDSILKCRLLRSHPQWRTTLTQQQQLAITDNPNHYEFLIKWKGYSNHDNTWEPFDNITNSPTLLNEFIIQKTLPEHWNNHTNSTSDTTSSIDSTTPPLHIEDNVVFSPPVDVMAR